MTICEWTALCDRPAEGELSHPKLGSWPICARCAARVSLAREASSTPAGALRVFQAYLDIHHPGVRAGGLLEDQDDYAPVLEGDSAPMLLLDKVTGGVWMPAGNVFLDKVKAMTPLRPPSSDRQSDARALGPLRLIGVA